MGKSSFTASGGGAKLTVTAKQIGWYGQLSLAFTPASHRAEPCATGSGVVYCGNGLRIDRLQHESEAKARMGLGRRVQAVLAPIQPYRGVGLRATNPPGDRRVAIGFRWSSPQPLEVVRSFSGSALHSVDTNVTKGTLTAFRLSTSEIDGTIVVRYDSEQEFSPAPAIRRVGLNRDGHD